MSVCAIVFVSVCVEGETSQKRGEVTSSVTTIHADATPRRCVFLVTQTTLVPQKPGVHVVGGRLGRGAQGMV